MKCYSKELFKGIDLTKYVIYIHKGIFFVTTKEQSELIHYEQSNKLHNTNIISGHYLNSPDISIPANELEGIFIV